MMISSISFFPLNIPFVEQFIHSKKTRNFSDTFLVKVNNSDGQFGFGESLVRSYVTGEVVEGVGKYLNEISNSIGRFDWSLGKEISDPISFLEPISKNLDQIISPLEKSISPNIIALNGLRCSLELAIVDLLLNEKKIPLSQFLNSCKKNVIYSGVISAGSSKKAIKIARQFKQLGIKDYKLKVTGLNDLETISNIRSIIGYDSTLRLDANSSFSVSSAIQFAKEIESYKIAAIEQPIQRGCFKDLASIQKSTTIPIMADESLITLNDAKKLIENDSSRIFNIRLAKCGGLYKSLQIARLAELENIPFQLGCMVGETALLSSVGRHFASYFQNCIFAEGSYGTLLLKEDLGFQSIRFGYGGKAPLLKGPSFGIKLNRNTIDKYLVTSLAGEFQCPN